MRIAQVAPLAESVPPKLYGGTERIVAYLTDQLVEQGHEVTLFASGDSQTRAELVSTTPRALRLEKDVVDPWPYHMVHLEEVRRQASRFDIIHFHMDVFPLPLVRSLSTPCVFTMHGRLDLPDLWPCYSAFNDVPLISISDYQRRPMPENVNWAATIHHGLPVDLLPAGSGDGGYLAFLGRISPEKRPDRAIEIAVRTGKRLKIAAKVDRADLDYWTDRIEPLIKAHDNVDYIGEINEHEKIDFLGRAEALLFPIDWPEPFGLVMIEAMSCACPVIAFRNGSVGEVIDDGVSGFVVGSVDEAVDRVGRVSGLPRSGVRAAFERRFSDARMAADHVAVYGRLMAERRLATELAAAMTPDAAVAAVINGPRNGDRRPPTLHAAE